MVYTQRISRTNQQLKDAFLDVLDRKTLSKITVNDIVDCAQVNRSTFYRHYDDIADLLTQIEDEIFVGMAKRRLQFDSFSIDQDNVTMMVDYCRQNQVILSRLLSDHGEGHFERRCKQVTKESFTQGFGEAFASNDEVQMIREGETANTLQILKFWLTAPNQLTVDQVAHTLVTMQRVGSISALQLLHDVLVPAKD